MVYSLNVLKQTTLITTILLCSLICPAQYAPLLKENAVWKQYRSFSNPAQAFVYFDNIQVAKQHNVVDGVTYDWFSRGYMREESNGKVYYRNVWDFEQCECKVEDTTEKLMFDISLMVGDTFYVEMPDISYIGYTISKTYTVLKVDTVLISGYKRKRIEFDHNLTFIEGIGSNHSLTGIFCMPNDCWDPTYKLMCYTDSIIEWKANGVDSCKYVDIASHEGIQQIKTYPNPFSEQLNFELPNRNFDFRLFNIHGNLIHFEVVNGSNSLNLGQLKNGLYLAIISEKGVVKKSFKLIKN